MVANSKTLGVSIECPPEKVYEFISDPENLPKWATAFCKSVTKSDGEWIVETPDGPMKIRFVERNKFGALDHYVSPMPGQEILNPMRVIPNGSGSEVIFTLFQLPGMSDDKYLEDAGLVERDLRTLKNVLEGDFNNS
ncbi:SRPBCC family protein [Effusibacillus consociatus]|uniref:SRPBCC family protein n=1 Tax=Effusibacillus consociatus TaxID=1117041 RepID=A0ABV9PXV0_9BACL